MQLPETFLYGATIGAHQVEGADFESDWWRWEQRPLRIRDGETSERGAGHLTRYEDDLKLARKLGHNAVCISVSWPRIQPAADRFDRNALDHYQRVFSSAASCGLTPLCILHHITQPVWFSERGGWHGADAATLFQDYARQVAATLGGLCRWWLPVYEPEFWLTRVYRERRWPGWEGGGYRAALRQLAAAQRLTAAAIREACPEALVGVSVRGAVVEPMDPHSPWDARAAQREQHRINMRFIEAAMDASDAGEGFMDFIGLSFYGAMRVRFAPLHIRGGFALPVDERGHDVEADHTHENAEGIEELLSTFAQLRKPILLTGVGMATEDDNARCLFLRRHIETLLRSMQSGGDGLDVRAFFCASLLDGFEWRHGYTRRYGLVHVKHPGLERTPNPSAWFFKDIAEHGCIREGAEKQFCRKEGDS
ncbi:MAG TPA: glycosyl hydrolase family protein [Candidatus Hydrogenedentes bacterium]|nr:glycosyl hydrolase family protein [Candidatus Hydrogenedentota bacterium]